MMINDALILSNGKFVKHIIDLEKEKEKRYQIRIIEEHVNNKANNKKSTYIYIILSVLLLLLFVTIISYTIWSRQNIKKQTSSIVSNIFSKYAVSDEIACSTSYNNTGCSSYFNGLSAIFGTTDILLATTDSISFNNALNDRITSSTVDLIFYNANTDTLLNTPDIVTAFNNKTNVKALIDLYGSNICETSSVSGKVTPGRTNTLNTCYGWIYISNPYNIQNIDVPSIDPFEQDTAIHAITLIGSIIDYNDEIIYYLLNNYQLDYELNFCASINSTSCNITNSQKLLFNALKYFSIVEKAGYSISSIWNAMNDNEYFKYSSFYVFINLYSSGYRYVHGEANKRNTSTSLNTELRVGADSQYGSTIDYERSNGQEKRSFILAPYPNPSSNRYYIGSGFQTGTHTASGDGGWLDGLPGWAQTIILVLLTVGITCGILCGGICGIVCVVWVFAWLPGWAKKQQQPPPVPNIAKKQQQPPPIPQQPPKPPSNPISLQKKEKKEKKEDKEKEQEPGSIPPPAPKQPPQPPPNPISSSSSSSSPSISPPAPKQSAPPIPPGSVAAPKQKQIKQEWPNTSSSSIDILILKQGTGSIPGGQSAVEIEYTGNLPNGKQFIKHREVIQLGKKQNIKGLEQAVTRIKVGCMIKLWIPSRLAYGARGAGNLIPPNADLTFQLQLHRIVKQ